MHIYLPNLNVCAMTLHVHEVSRVHDKTMQAEIEAPSRHLSLKLISSHSQFMGWIVEKVGLFYDIFATFIVFVDIHILLTLLPQASALFRPPLHVDVMNGWPHGSQRSNESNLSHKLEFITTRASREQNHIGTWF